MKWTVEVVSNVKTEKRMTKWSFLELFKLEKDKTHIVFVSYIEKGRKRAGRSNSQKWWVLV